MNKEIETKILNLTEERGVANGTYKYQKLLVDIFKEIQSYLYKNYNPKIDKYTYNITKTLPWIEELNIVFNIRNYKEQNGVDWSDYTEGGYKMNSNSEIINNKLKEVFLNIRIISVDGTIDRKGYNLNMFHELNHMYEDYNKPNLTNYLIDLNYKKILNGSNNSEVSINYFCNISYRLLFTTEFNSLISSVYGELKAMNSPSYQQDYTKTQAYKVYYNIKMIWLPYLQNLPYQQWERFLPFLNQKENSENNLQSFKNLFIKNINYRLTDLFKGMAKTGSLWNEEYRKINRIDEEDWVIGKSTDAMNKNITNEQSLKRLAEEIKKEFIKRGKENEKN